MDIKPNTMTITQLLLSRCQFSFPDFKGNILGKKETIVNLLMI